jgi:hypothetical protein
MLYLHMAPVLQQYFDSILWVGVVVLILPCPIRFLGEGNKLEETFAWLQSATGCNEELPPVHYVFLKVKMCLCYCLYLMLSY